MILQETQSNCFNLRTVLNGLCSRKKPSDPTVVRIDKMSQGLETIRQFGAKESRHQLGHYWICCCGAYRTTAHERSHGHHLRQRDNYSRARSDSSACQAETNRVEIACGAVNTRKLENALRNAEFQPDADRSGPIRTALDDLRDNFGHPESQGPNAYADQMILDHPELDFTTLRADAVIAIDQIHTQLLQG